MQKTFGEILAGLGCIVFFAGLGTVVVDSAQWFGHLLWIIGGILFFVGLRLYRKWRYMSEDEGGSFGPEGKRRYHK